MYTTMLRGLRDSAACAGILARRRAGLVIAIEIDRKAFLLLIDMVFACDSCFNIYYIKIESLKVCKMKLKFPTKPHDLHRCDRPTILPIFRRPHLVTAIGSQPHNEAQKPNRKIHDTT